ncbi:MAG: FecR domain-containing protein [Pirellulales bacterium]
MNRYEPMPSEIRSLVDDLINGVITQDNLRQLELQLDGSSKLQQSFRGYCQLHINLDTEMRSQRVVDDVAQRISMPDSTIHAQVANKAVLASARRPSVGGWLGLATCALLMVTLASLALRSTRGLVADDRDAGSQPNRQELDVITVRLGTAESRTLPIGDVGSVTIQGPAHFELIGTMRARLHQGRIKVRIDDERGHGFVVETPRGHVTDLGTEFGVDVDGESTTGVVVFEGEVDLTLPSQKALGGLRVERLIQGDGLSVQHPDQLDRIMSIVTGNVTTFQQQGEARLGTAEAIIADVSDNIRSSGFKKFYEIVPAGLREDALAYADRPQHDWNGVDAQGMPSYLIGADYVKPFNNDKMRGDVELSVTLARPARLFIFFDTRVPAPNWLHANFQNTGETLGLDVGRYVLDGVEFFRADQAEGAGNSIDATFSIWEQEVRQPGVVRLGPNSGGSEFTAMYGIAAIRLETPRSK